VSNGFDSALLDVNDNPRPPYCVLTGEPLSDCPGLLTSVVPGHPKPQPVGGCGTHCVAEVGDRVVPAGAAGLKPRRGDRVGAG
jgi:hypothetical protein